MICTNSFESVHRCMQELIDAIDRLQGSLPHSPGRFLNDHLRMSCLWTTCVSDLDRIRSDYGDPTSLGIDNVTYMRFEVLTELFIAAESMVARLQRQLESIAVTDKSIIFQYESRSLYLSLREICTNLSDIASQCILTSSATSMNCVYASPEQMGLNRAFDNSERPYPILHAGPLEDGDEIPDLYTEDHYGSPDTTMQHTPPVKIIFDPDQTMQICKACGNAFPMDSKFCPYCGQHTGIDQ